MRRIIPIEPYVPRLGTPEPQSGGTALDQLVADVLARQELLVRARLDLLVDPGVAARVEAGDVVEPGQRGVVEAGAVGERLADGAGLQVGSVVVKVLTARDRDGAEPVLVGGLAVGAGARERVALVRGRLARDLREGLVEVGVHGRGKVVIELGQLRRVAIARVAGHRVGDLIAEVEVDNQRAVAVICAHVRSVVAPRQGEKDG